MTAKKKTKVAERKVYCPNCGGNFHVTTEQFRPRGHAHPGMIRLIEPYLSWGWSPPPPDPSAGYGSLECPDCGAAMAPDGKLMVGK